jgi:hypothetical protein
MRLYASWERDRASADITWRGPGDGLRGVTRAARARSERAPLAAPAASQAPEQPGSLQERASNLSPTERCASSADVAGALRSNPSRVHMPLYLLIFDRALLRYILAN